MIKILDNVWAIPVPLDATEICIDKYPTHAYFSYLSGGIRSSTNEYSDTILDGILPGTVTATEIDFDCESVICDHLDLLNSKDGVLKTIEGSYCKAFRSALTAANLHFTNPYGKTRPIIYDEDAGTEREHLGSKWDAAENDLVQKLVIIKKL